MFSNPADERTENYVTGTVRMNARRIYGHELDPRLRGMIARMSEHAQQLFRFAVDAYDENDAPLGAALDDIDDNLDRAHADFIAAIFDTHKNGKVDLPVAVQLALVGRFYERIGDHAVNIGERVHYMVTGWMPEHTGAARLQVREWSTEGLPASAPPDGTRRRDHGVGAAGDRDRSAPRRRRRPPGAACPKGGPGGRPGGVDPRRCISAPVGSHAGSASGRRAAPARARRGAGVVAARGSGALA
jgi:hypothetical protein